MKTIQYGAVFMDGQTVVQELSEEDYDNLGVHRIELSATSGKLSVYYLANDLLYIGLEKPGFARLERGRSPTGHLLVQIEEDGIFWSVNTIAHWDHYRATKQLLDNQDIVIDRISSYRFLTSHAEFVKAAGKYMAEQFVIHPRIYENSQYYPLMPQAKPE